MTVSDHLITSRRNFLVGATAFTAAGGAVTVPIITVADARARVQHHMEELHKVLRDLYPNVTFFVRGRLPDQLTSDGPVVVMVSGDDPEPIAAANAGEQI
jgi:hypothetical protein